MKQTQGKWNVLPATTDHWYIESDINMGGILICDLLTDNTTEEAEANAELIAEAGTVANETGFTPRQLADQNKKFGEALKELSNPESANDVSRLKHIIDSMKILAEQALKPPKQ